MTFWTDLVNTALAPLILSCSDMFILFYLCGGNRDIIRRNKHWWLNFSLLLIGIVVTECIFNGGTGQDARIYEFYVIRYVFLLLFSFLCTDTLRNACYYLVILVLLSTDIALIAFVSVLLRLFHTDFLVAGPVGLRLVSHAVLLVFKIVLAILIKKQTRSQIYGISSLYQAAIIMLPALPYFYMRNYPHILSVRPIDIPLSIHYVTILCGICALINMIVSENLSYQIQQNEMLRMENLIKNQYDQYKVALNTIEAVNHRYHDLRHILRGIDSMQDIAEIKSYVHSIEGEIKNYDLICNTGNKTIDIILSDRTRECVQKGIRLHVNANGQGWDIIHDADIATIFGNALDNAIESTELINDGTPRIINVRVGQVKNMIIARFENRYTHTLEKKQAQFLSTKQDKLNHGFGLRSLELTLKKYNGEMNIKAEKGFFILTVLICCAQG